MSCLVTVGSTNFDALLKALDAKFIEALLARHISRVSIQIGRTGHYEPTDFVKQCEEAKIQADFFQFRPDFSDYVKGFDLIISHAGAGSVLDALHSKKKLLVIVNEQLMDNHQIELAEALAQQQYLYFARVSTFVDVLKAADFDQLKPFPDPDLSVFADLVDEEMGFKPKTH